MRLALNSWRARIFLVTALIVALVLASVALLGGSSVLENERQRLDERLCNEARRLATQPPLQDLDRIETDIAAKLHLPGVDRLLLMFDGPGGEGPVRSAAWPAGLDIDRLAWSGPGEPPPPMPAPDPPPPPSDTDVPPPPPHEREGGEGGRPPRADSGRPGFDRPPRPGPIAERPARSEEDWRGPGGGGPNAAQPGRPPRRGGWAGPVGMPPPRACRLAALSVAGADWRAGMVATPRGRGFAAADLAASREELRSALQRAATVALPLALALTAAGAWLLSALAMRPVARLREAMKSVDEKALGQRLPVEREDREFQALIDAYNRMLARLEASFHQAQRFSSDAAHELKTPLTILQGQLERAIQGAENRAIQVHLVEMLDEVGRLASISRKLLMLSQADAGQLALRRSPVDLSHLLGECIADAQMLGPALAISCDIPAGLRVQADEELLRQILNNLVGNALKYTPPGGWFTVAAEAQAAGVELRFSNSAPGLSAEQRRRFFERFFRGDAAHNRRIDGHGLGLSLSRVIARAHGGELSLKPGTDGLVVLMLWLPRS